MQGSIRQASASTECVFQCLMLTQRGMDAGQTDTPLAHLMQLHARCRCAGGTNMPQHHAQQLQNTHRLRHAARKRPAHTCRQEARLRLPTCSTLQDHTAALCQGLQRRQTGRAAARLLASRSSTRRADAPVPRLAAGRVAVAAAGVAVGGLAGSAVTQCTVRTKACCAVHKGCQHTATAPLGPAAKRQEPHQHPT